MNEDRDKALRRSAALARFLDESIPVPGTGFRIGWDFLIGLVPGIGDLLAGILSTYIVGQALEQGVPRVTVMRMVWNILVETVLGSVPFLGDLFDAAWKANIRNARLLETSLRNEKAVGKKDLLFMTMVIGGLVLVAVLSGLLGLAIIKAVHDWIVAVS